MYRVYMVNFNLYKGTFKTLDEAVDHAKALGFECAIYKQDNETSVYVRSVKPY